jgi:hypothetical protein
MSALLQRAWRRAPLTEARWFVFPRQDLATQFVDRAQRAGYKTYSSEKPERRGADYLVRVFHPDDRLLRRLAASEHGIVELLAPGRHHRRIVRRVKAPVAAEKS